MLTVELGRGRLAPEAPCVERYVEATDGGRPLPPANWLPHQPVAATPLEAARIPGDDDQHDSGWGLSASRALLARW